MDSEYFRAVMERSQVFSVVLGSSEAFSWV